MRRALISFAVVLASGAAFATPTIHIDGVCPSITVTLSAATPNRQVTLFTGDPSATTTLASGPCAGTVVDVAGANQPRHQLVTTRTDSDGGLVFTPASVSSSDCASGSLQGIDLTTCETTEAVPLQIDCSGLDDGLLAYWPGNDNHRDVVGSHNGIIEGTIDYAPGVFGDAFVFDGYSSILVPDDDDLAFGYAVPFTYAMWIYNETSSTSPHHLFGKRRGCSGGNSFDYQYYMISDYQGAGAYACSAAARPQPPVDEWQHVIAMYDGVAWTLYMDGELADESAECAESEMPVLGSPLRIGSSGTCGARGEGWIGLVDDVKLWDRALTEDEIVCASSPVRAP